VVGEEVVGALMWLRGGGVRCSVEEGKGGAVGGGVGGGGGWERLVIGVCHGEHENVIWKMMLIGKSLGLVKMQLYSLSQRALCGGKLRMREGGKKIELPRFRKCRRNPVAQEWGRAKR